MIEYLGSDSTILLGGRRTGEEQDRVIVSEKWLGSPTLSTDNASSQSSNAEARLPGFILVADFLQKICPIRFRILAGLMQSPRADAANNGMASPARDDLEVPPDDLNNLVDVQWDDAIS
jgi:hypothetical protein